MNDSEPVCLRQCFGGLQKKIDGLRNWERTLLKEHRREVNAVGQQWLWRFDYPTATDTAPPYNTFTFNTLVVPVNTPIDHVSVPGLATIHWPGIATR